MSFEMRPGNQENWDEIIATLPGKHILQTWEWGESKRISGWKPIHIILIYFGLYYSILIFFLIYHLRQEYNN